MGTIRVVFLYVELCSRYEESICLGGVVGFCSYPSQERERVEGGVLSCLNDVEWNWRCGDDAEWC